MTDDEKREIDDDQQAEHLDEGPADTEGKRTPPTLDDLRARGAVTFPDGALNPMKAAMDDAFSNTTIAKQFMDAQKTKVSLANFATMAAQTSGLADAMKGFSAAQRIAMPKIEIPNAAALALGEQYLRIAEGQQRIVDQIMPEVDTAASVLTGIAKSQNAMIARAMRPVLDVHTMWGEQLAAQRRSILSTIAPTLTVFKNIRRALFPANLRDIDQLDMSVVDDIVLNEGIALYGVPRAAIVADLVAASDVDGRRAILVESGSEILADCRVAADQCVSDDGAPYVRQLIAAIVAIADGHTAAGQALTGSLIDAVLGVLFEKFDSSDLGKGLKPKKDDKKPAAYDDLGVLDLIAFAPIWRTYQHYFAMNGDPVPSTFSRHATAHSVSDIQYSECNAIQGVMIACALLLRVDEVLYARQEQEEAS